MAVAKSGTLTPNVVTEVVITVENTGSNNEIGVLNRSQDGVIWVRTDSHNPVIEGDDSFPVMNYRIFSARQGYSSIKVRMISDTAIEYTVEGKS